MNMQVGHVKGYGLESGILGETFTKVAPTPCADILVNQL